MSRLRNSTIKLQVEHWSIQVQVAAAVCDVFNPQSMRTTTYCLDWAI